MQLFDFDNQKADPISRFDAQQASSIPLGHGNGDIHVYALHFGPDGVIGLHPTGFCQLFLVVQGEGWVSVGNEERVLVKAGQGAYFDIGEHHSKGSDNGMMVIMVQASELSRPDA